MKEKSCSTVVTAGDAAYAWGTLLLVASMRRNGMEHPVVVGAMDWPETMRKRVSALGGVSFIELPKSRQCLTCQKPMLMNLDSIATDWVCWADSDGIFVGDCSEWLCGGDPDEISVRKYNPAPSDFTPATLETWHRDVERFAGGALAVSRYETRVNAPFIVLHRKWRPFLERWQHQIESVLPPTVGIVMAKGSPYFQTDESVLGSLLCFDPAAPAVSKRYNADGSADSGRFYAHFAYNPKPWQMWNRYTMRYRRAVADLVAWIVSNGIAKPSELPPALRSSWWPFWRMAAPLAPWVWRAKKLGRKMFG